ncbi:MAG: hypothetical protein CYG59_10195 [Chloroflexi bacterium]|nr:MAG: hypothetical protein CYG59_10195 [Chloroflexota bacterium]
MARALFRADFPITEEYAYLNHASIAPYSRRKAHVSRIAQRIIHLTDTLIAVLQARDYRIMSNLAPAHRSGIVIVDVPDAETARARLLATKVVTGARGRGLRVAPHFYNTEADVLRVGEVLGDRAK